MTVCDVMYLKRYSEVTRSPILYQRMGRLYRKMIVPLAVRKAFKVITISRFSADDIKCHIPFLEDSDIIVAYLATHAVFRILVGLATDDVMRTYGLSEGYILAVGGTDPRKNTEFMISNYIRLKREGKITEKLVVAGVANWRKSSFYAMVRRANCTGDVSFTDFISVEELAALYKGARAVLYLSLYEGFGIPALEAMTCGVPLITSNTTSIPEIVGDGAMVIDPTDSAAFTRSLVRLLNDEPLRKELIARGLERAKEFSWKKNAETALSIYTNAVHA